MNKHKYYFIIILLLLFANTQAQSLAFKNSSKRLVANNYFSLNDSVQTSTIVYYNERAGKALKVGAWTGVIGAVVGLAVVGSLASDFFGSDHTTIPAAMGGIGLVLGTTVGYILNSNNRVETFEKKQFNQIGISATFLLPVNDSYYGMDYTFGLSYRTLNNKLYLPSRISLQFSTTDKMHYNYYDRFIWSDGTSISIEGVYVNYNKLFSVLYGLEVGMFFANASEYNDASTVIPYKEIATPFIDLIAGFNINIFSFLSWECAYKYEPFGPYQKLKPNNSEMMENPYKVTTSLLVYF